MISLLEALSPTTAALLDPEMHFFTVTYEWQCPPLGALRNSTVIWGVDAEAALKSFRSKHPHLTGAWITTKEAV